MKINIVVYGDFIIRWISFGESLYVIKGICGMKI